MKIALFITLLLLAAFSVQAVARAPSVFITPIDTDKYEGLAYSILTPDRPLSHLLLRFDLEILNPEGLPIDVVQCGIQWEMKARDALPHAFTQDGALWLSFDDVPPETLLKFAVGWPRSDQGRVFAHKAAVTVESPEWHTTKQWQRDPLYDFVPGRPVTITVGENTRCWLN